nr:MAG TPA: hypothetical protein [Siphoviridae sp. ct8TV20]
MVKRYPHTAIVTIEANGKLVKGEWVKGEPIEITISGRYDPVNDGAIVMKANSLGEEKQVHGYFYTKVQPPENTYFLSLIVKTKGINAPIVCWEPYQSHSVICV